MCSCNEHEADAWIRGHVEPVGPTEVVHELPWATVRRVPIATGSSNKLHLARQADNDTQI